MRYFAILFTIIVPILVCSRDFYTLVFHAEDVKKICELQDYFLKRKTIILFSEDPALFTSEFVSNKRVTFDDVMSFKSERNRRIEVSRLDDEYIFARVFCDGDSIYLESGNGNEWRLDCSYISSLDEKWNDILSVGMDYIDIVDSPFVKSTINIEKCVKEWDSDWFIILLYVKRDEDKTRIVYDFELGDNQSNFILFKIDKYGKVVCMGTYQPIYQDNYRVDPKKHLTFYSNDKNLFETPLTNIKLSELYKMLLQHDYRNVDLYKTDNGISKVLISHRKDSVWYHMLDNTLKIDSLIINEPWGLNFKVNLRPRAFTYNDIFTQPDLRFYPGDPLEMIESMDGEVSSIDILYDDSQCEKNTNSTAPEIRKIRLDFDADGAITSIKAWATTL